MNRQSRFLVERLDIIQMYNAIIIVMSINMVSMAAEVILVIFENSLDNIKV